MKSEENAGQNGEWFKPGCTIRQACAGAAERLSGQGVDEARNDAEQLLMHVLELDRAALLFRWNEPFPADRSEQWRRVIARRGTGEPLQYIMGEGWFYGRSFQVSPSVLIPRPETELLVEAVLDAADRLWGSFEATLIAGEASHAAGAAGCENIGPTVVDVGTGSGAIAVTLAALRPGWRITASDLSPDALEVARANAIRHGVADRLAFAQGDLLAPFIAAGRGGTAIDGGRAVDVLVSNPPYIPAADLSGLQREVRDYEPHLALDGGADGLAPYRAMLEQLALLPAMPRIVAFELGMGQPEIVAAWMRDMEMWDDISIVTDLNGIKRHIIAVSTEAHGDRN
ncbi:peptide chain release factor N(5)-glutamine methyltransferase [Paenibacillus sp. CAU 1782]